MLTVDHVKKVYQDFALDCSLEVRPGCVTGLIGQNGAGKSTTFKAALGLIHTDSGNIELFGEDSASLSAGTRQKLGVVLSDSGFSSYLTAGDIAHILKNMYEKYEDRKFRDLCQKFNIPLDKKLQEFSTGMKAKFKLITALTHRAQLLILDEPTVGLDVVARDELLDLLRGYMSEDDSRSILISSHISSDLEGLCDDIYMIHDGKIILHEDTDVLLSNYALLKLDPSQFEALDKQYILKYKKESFGYSCLTDQKQFYMENYPEAVIEKGNIDDLIVMMIGGGAL